MRKFVALIAAIMVLLPQSAAFADNHNRPVPQIRVTGEGSSEIPPDMAIVTMTVLREADTAREALSENNKAMAAVMAAMTGAGIAERDLQTSNFNITPRYSRAGSSIKREEPPRIDGYRVSNSLTVRVRDLAKLGDILDLSVTLGVNQGGNIAFANDDASAALEAARIDAMKDALKRARTLTEAAGVGLGSILEISEQSFQPSPVPIARARTMAMEAIETVPVAGGENQYRVTVNVAIELKQ